MMWLRVIAAGVALFAAFAAGAWLEQGGKSKESDYDDE
jgi:hypothetical protein